MDGHATSSLSSCGFDKATLSEPRQGVAFRAGGAVRARSAAGGRLFSHRRSRSEEHTSESSHLVISYAVFCLKKKEFGNDAFRLRDIRFGANDRDGIRERVRFNHRSFAFGTIFKERIETARDLAGALIC